MPEQASISSGGRELVDASSTLENLRLDRQGSGEGVSTTLGCDSGIVGPFTLNCKRLPIREEFF